MSKHSAIEIIARGVFIQHGCVLLCQNTDKGYFYLPGGHVEPGEPASVALAREFVEETGRQVLVGDLLLASEHAFRQGKQDRHELNLVFHVEQVQPERGKRRSAKPRKASASKSRSRKGDDGGVFHVERPDLPHFPSLEKGIAFGWVDLAAIISVDLRPLSLRAWLASGGVVGPARRSDLPAMGWLSDFPTQ